ncbi:Helicase associated domain protein (plasmid) [Streptomyces rochei]|uniref:Helicase associated domain protein n=1 Tax=Streptomyces rochei TaxID=1928 RepID=UPI00402AB26E
MLRSRQGTDMTAAFSEIADAALAQLPADTDTGRDGELVVWEGERLAFERLQQRLARRRGAGAAAAARAWPAHLVVFAVVRLEGADLAPWNQAAKQFYEREGRLQAPRKHVERTVGEDQEEREHKLGAWIGNQRSRAATLSPERVEQLSAIGMRWA